MLKAVALAQEAQLKMLRYQLNPHFLFNTLNGHLHAHPRQPEPQGEPRRDAPVGVPALHPRPGPR